MTRKPRRDLGEVVRLKPADPFELIRWLARSQGDPRKALAELVQNSLDANARAVRIERRRLGGAPALVVHDEGEGVLPEMSREDALRYLAQHIGHSRKLQLTPSERRERIIAGKYGVGLLGFWSIGRRFELRSRVGGGKTWALALVEDQPGGRIVELPARVDAPATYTEAVVLDVHDAALRSFGGAKLASYLGSELRGQLLSRDVDLIIYDGMARGTAQKRFDVKPRKFLGEPLDVPREIEVPGHDPLRVELYLARGEPDAAVQIACAGTIVAERMSELASLGVDPAPWTGRELVGVLDFADFNVPPGARRGVVPDEAARAFAAALDQLRPLVLAELARFTKEKDRNAQRDLVKELRRALRGFARRLPQYELPAVTDGGEVTARGRAESNGATGIGLGASGAPEPVGEDTDAEPEPIALFPPGELAAAKIVPNPIVLRPGRERRVRALALDAEGRLIRRPVSFAWSTSGSPDIEVHGDGPHPALAAVPDARASTAQLEVVVVEGATMVRALAAVAIDDREELASPNDHGVPEPVFESDPRGAWRSRLDGNRWVVNDAHEDWVELRTEPRARVRYALALFAKDVVSRSFAAPGSADVLERMVEILAHAERNLRGA